MNGWERNCVQEQQCTYEWGIFALLLTCAASSFYSFLMYFLYVTYFMLSLCAVFALSHSLTLCVFVSLCAMKSSTLLLLLFATNFFHIWRWLRFILWLVVIKLHDLCQGADIKFWTWVLYKCKFCRYEWVVNIVCR